MMNNIEIFPWNESFCTHLPLIDQQHQNLVQLINQLAEQHVTSASLDSVNATFTQLAEYAVYHFESEEAIWHQYMPDAVEESEHKEAHNKFINAVSQIKLEQDAKSIEEVLTEVLHFLIRWLLTHILVDDMNMSKIVLGLNSGLTMKASQRQAIKEINETNRLADSILHMYEKLSINTMELMRENEKRRTVEKKLHLTSMMVNNTLEAMCIIDAEGNIVTANPAFGKSIQLPESEFIHKNILDIKFEREQPHIKDKFSSRFSSGEKWSGLITTHDRNDKALTEWCSISAHKASDKQRIQSIIVFSNITNLIKEHKEIEFLAHHDGLTGLPNKNSLLNRINEDISRSQRENTSLAVCFLDLDGFKLVNDTFGHDAGDTVLITVASRIQQQLREEDTVSRIGGDEFLLLMNKVNDFEDCKQILERIIDSIQQPITSNASDVTVSASIGVTIFPEDSSSPQELIRHADHAMYQAKQAGKSRYKCYKAT